VHVLRETLENGGAKLLDLRARNEAIELMKLKSYLHPTLGRPLWAWVADGLLRISAVSDFRRIEDKYLINPYIQEWRVNSNAKSLPRNLKAMVKCAEKHNAQCLPLTISWQTKLQMPYWYHIGTRNGMPHIYNDRWAKCQRENHAISSVGEMLEHADKNRYIDHVNRWNCDCAHCYNDTILSCEDPIECRRNADRKLDLLMDEWDPTSGKTE
ncbi:hypothetical protein BKA70DRAFT_1033196, partial [Coprinopsis sp. MPI-PUGE-AT-0042]